MKLFLYVLYFIFVIRTVYCNTRQKRQASTASERGHNAGYALGQALGGTVNNLLGGLLGIGNTNKQTGCNVNNGGCGQGCVVKQSRIHCYCISGYVLNRDQRSCTDINECSLGPQKVCQDKCINTLGSYFCSCSNGVLLGDGKSCTSQPTISCAENNGGCEQECKIKGNGQISCKCGKGFVLAEDQKSCYDIDECSKGNKCRPGNTCVNTYGGYMCSLDEISSCTVKNGGCDHMCRETNRGIVCKCNNGFKLQRDFKSCRPVKGNCAAKNGGCQQICLNKGKRIQCLCGKGYELHKNGRSCILSNAKPKPTDPCQNNNGGCDQICLSDGDSVKCDCKEGFVLAHGQCIEPRNEARPTPLVSSQRRGCGINMKKTLFRRIVGGKPADPKDWPWMAAILRNSGSQFCGGALITDRHVLTAAHCVIQFTKNDIKVRLGEYDFDTPDENSPTDFGVEEIRMHENYDRSTQENDIAIIKLNKPSSFSDFIWPVCLPPPDTTFENQLGFVTGWGTIYFGGPVSNKLLEVVLPVWKQNQCVASYPENKVTENMMCAGLKEGGKDSCQGDSGGPFLTQIQPNPHWYVAGIVSWGIECAGTNRPGVYTRVSKYLNWIKTNAVF